MSTMPITLSTYNSANMHVNDVNMQYAEVVGTCLWSRRPVGHWSHYLVIPLSQWPSADSLLLPLLNLVHRTDT